MVRPAGLFVITLLAGGMTVVAAPAGQGKKEKEGAPPPRLDGRLPRDVEPRHYGLELVVDPAAKGFSGRVTIDVTIKAPTRYIVMHARALTIRQASVTAGARGKIPVAPQLRLATGSRGDPEELLLVAEQALAPGDAKIEIAYDGLFGEGLAGLYRVTEGARAYAFTQFEPTDARRAFPCFDEPGWKVPFDVTVDVPPGSLAFANTRELARQPNGAMVRFTFEPSPPLPTYLLALAVGPFDILTGPRSPTAIRLIATPGHVALGRTAVDSAAAQLRLLASYFDRDYPYSKLDLLAVPNFGAGAMENPGLVTFREERLLIDPNRTSTSARQSMAGTMAHELAHQWFGNLVTMRWWDDLWLSEAFASLMGDKTVDAWKPTSRARVQSLAVKSQVMVEDSLATARRIRSVVRSTSEAQEAFDGITYAKGRAVLAMVEAWLGEATFRAGLRLYLKQHQWGNARATDLYEALEAASGRREVASVMNSFTDQVGVPLVSAKLSCGPDDAAPAILLSQREYRTLDRKRDGPALWQIPVCVHTVTGNRSAKRCMLLDRAEASLTLTGTNGRPAPCPRLMYANAGELGYYRVALDAAELAGLTPAAVRQLPESERLGLLSNAWAGVWSGDLPASSFLELATIFKGEEQSSVVWTQIVLSLYAMDRTLVTDDARPAFARFVRELLGNIARRVGWVQDPNEPDERRLLRESVLTAMGWLGEDPATVAQAERIAHAWLARPATTSADLARVALPLVARKGDRALFDRLLEIVQRPQTPDVRLLALSGLVSFDDKELVERALDLTLDGTIKTQDLRYVFQTPDPRSVFPGLAFRRTTRHETYQWMETHFDALAASMPRFLVGRLVRSTGASCDEARVRRAMGFFGPRIANIEGTEKDLRQSVEEGLRCATLAKKELAPTSAWLSATTASARIRPAPARREP